MQTRAAPLLSILLGVLSGCVSDEVESVVEVGWVDYAGDLAIIEVPATATRGVPFPLRVSTVAGGCMRVESTEVSSTSDALDLTPYDRRVVPSEGEACTAALVHLLHEEWVTFDSAGPKTVRIHGRRRLAQPGVHIEMVQLLHTVMVQ